MTTSTETGFAETARGRIYFEVSGRVGDPAMVFLAMPTSRGGGGEMAEAWRQDLGKDFRFLTCDYPAGAGGSELRADAPPMTPDQVAADYIAIADAAGFDRFVCAGYSVGGNMSMQIAVRHPERLTALVVGGWPVLGGDFSVALNTLKQQQYHFDADTELGRYYAEHPELRASAAASAGAFIDYYEGLQNWDERGAAEALKMPRLNFADAEDMGYPDSNAVIEIGPALVRHEAELRAMGWETQVLRTGAGKTGAHLAVMQQPTIALPLLRAFLGPVLRLNGL